MRRSDPKHISQAGFAITELLVAIFIASLLFWAVSETLFSLASSNSLVTRSDILEQTKNDLQAELSNSIRWAQNIQILDTDELEVVDTDGTTILYQLVDGKIERKAGGISEPLTPDSIWITSFTVEKRGQTLTATPKMSLLITVSMQHRNFTNIQETIRIVATQRIAT